MRFWFSTRFRAAASLVVALSAVGFALGCTQDAPVTTPDPRPKAQPPVDTPLFSPAPVAHQMVLLHTSDNESDILGAGASAGSNVASAARGGIGRAVSVMDALRARASAPVLTVAAGDTLMPAPELKVDFGRENAVATANNLLKYDVSALGNHEFDFGENYLASFIAQAKFPYLSASVTMTGGPLAKRHVGGGKSPTPTSVTWLSRHAGALSTRGRLCVGAALEDKDGVLQCPGSVVGVVGATTERLRTLSKISQNVDVKDSLEAVAAAIQAEVDILTSQGVTFVVLLSHLQDVRKELGLVELGLHGVDIIVAGGGDNRLANPSHRLLDGDNRDELCASLAPGPSVNAASCYPIVRRASDGRPVLIVATDGQLKYLGHLAVSWDANGVLTGFDRNRSHPWPVDETSLLELRAEMSKEALAFEARVREYLAPLMKPFSTTSVYLDGTRESVRNHETNLGNLSSDAMMWSALEAAKAHPEIAPPTFAMRNGGGIRSSIGTIDPDTSARGGGPIRSIDVQSALRFDNPLVIVTSTHHELRLALESAFREVGTGRGSFPHVSAEVKLAYNAAGAEQEHHTKDGNIIGLGCTGSRVQDLVITPPGQQPIVVVKDAVTRSPNAKISFVTLAYMAGGGDGAFPTCVDNLLQSKIEATEQNSFVAFIEHETRNKTWHGASRYKPVTNQVASFTRVKPVSTPPPPPPASCRKK